MRPDLGFLTDARPVAAAQHRARGWRAWLQRRVRASEAAFVVVAIAVGAAAGLLAVVQAVVAHGLQHRLFALPLDGRLSAAETIAPARLLALPVGGASLALFSFLVLARRRRLVDAVEANALHGGRMSLVDSLVIAGQTILSNGFGASVGLEAAYAQMGGAVSAIAGKALNLRRADMRTLVGAGAGAAIAAAFGTPLTGAFYAFEIVIGAYTPSAIAPVAAAALAAVLVAHTLGNPAYVISAVEGAPVETHHYLIYAGLGAVAAAIGILLMQAVTVAERTARALPLPDTLRPVVGGALMVPIAMVSPQVLSSGHGALHSDLALGAPLAFIATIFVAKCAASIVSLGFGFRGGLFFASLFLGTLLGHMFADGVTLAAGHVIIDPRNAALVGMAALAVAVVGGPMTMSMLVLETTRDFALTGATIAAALVSSTIVRESFGYSFSTWRLHLRGETIKSARDVGWMKTLTAGRMMRREPHPVSAAFDVAAFRHAYPLGSTSRVVLVDADDRYAGIVQTAAAYVEGVEPDLCVADLAINADVALAPDMDIAEVMRTFDASGSDELAVADAHGRVLGILSETHVRRRYAEELEKAQRVLFGER